MKLVDTMHEIMESHFQEEYGIPDWKYREIPWMTIEFWDQLIDMIGKENIKVISGSRRQGVMNGNKVDTWRCSCMISPEGMKNLAR